MNSQREQQREAKIKNRLVIGRVLRLVRVINGDKQTTVAKALGMPDSNYSVAEKTGEISLRRIKKFCLIMEVDPAVFMAMCEMLEGMSAGSRADHRRAILRIFEIGWR